MREENKTRLELIKELYETADEIFCLTNKLNIVGQPSRAEKEIDDYLNLLGKREPLIKKMSDIKRLIDNIKSESISSAEQEKFKSAEEKVAAIIALDKRNDEIVANIMDTLRASMKGIRNEKNLRNMYAHPIENIMPSRFDSKH